jgi:CheY-like chemotaxis protein
MTIIARGLTVLLAEDEEDDLFLVRRAFQKLNLYGQCIALEDGADVIDYLRAAGANGDRHACPLPDLLVLDHRMPIVSGLDALSWIRSQLRFQQLPVLILTGGLMPSELEMTDRLRAGVCLKRPCFKELVEAIAEGVRQAQRVAQPGTRPLLPIPDSQAAAAEWDGGIPRFDTRRLFSKASFNPLE